MLNEEYGTEKSLERKSMLSVWERAVGGAAREMIKSSQASTKAIRDKAAAKRLRVGGPSRRAMEAELQTAPKEEKAGIRRIHSEQ